MQNQRSWHRILALMLAVMLAVGVAPLAAVAANPTLSPGQRETVQQPADVRYERDIEIQADRPITFTITTTAEKTTVDLIRPSSGPMAAGDRAGDWESELVGTIWNRWINNPDPNGTATGSIEYTVNESGTYWIRVTPNEAATLSVSAAYYGQQVVDVERDNFIHFPTQTAPSALLQNGGDQFYFAVNEIDGDGNATNFTSGDKYKGTTQELEVKIVAVTSFANSYSVKLKASEGDVILTDAVEIGPNTSQATFDKVTFSEIPKDENGTIRLGLYVEQLPGKPGGSTAVIRTGADTATVKWVMPGAGKISAVIDDSGKTLTAAQIKNDYIYRIGMQVSQIGTGESYINTNDIGAPDSLDGKSVYYLFETTNSSSTIYEIPIPAFSGGEPPQAITYPKTVTAPPYISITAQSATEGKATLTWDEDLPVNFQLNASDQKENWFEYNWAVMFSDGSDRYMVSTSHSKKLASPTDAATVADLTHMLGRGDGDGYIGRANNIGKPAVGARTITWTFDLPSDADMELGEILYLGYSVVNSPEEFPPVEVTYKLVNGVARFVGDEDSFDSYVNAGAGPADGGDPDPDPPYIPPYDPGNDDADADDSGSGGGDSGSGPAAASGPSAVSPAAATASVNAALAAARAGGAGGGATARLLNPGNIALATLQSMATLAGDTPLRVNADSMNGAAVDVRITINPALATVALDLSASTTNEAARRTDTLFEQYFSNDLMTVALGQQGGFGMPVDIAAKLDPALNTTNLIFYNYDPATNTYRQIAAPAYWVDVNGYVHFTTDQGGRIIISDGPLTRLG